MPRENCRIEPNYWMWEISGILQPVIQKYLDLKPLTAEEIATMRAYLRQWIASPLWDLNPYSDNEAKEKLKSLRADIEILVTVNAIDRWIETAAAEGFDPL